MSGTLPRMRFSVPLTLVLVLLLAGCGGGSSAQKPEAASSPRNVAAQAPAAPTAGTLSKVANGQEAARRLAYANLDGLAQAELPVSRRRVLQRVLRSGADEADGRKGLAVQVADATVFYGAKPTVVGGSRQLVARLRHTAPETSAITPIAPSAAQSCLGDTLAQTILGAETMGADAALGVGLAESGDAPAGIQLRICGAPRLIRDLHAMEKAMRARFGHLGESAKIGEQEIGEREIVAGTIAAHALPRRTVLDLLSGGRELRALAWR